MKARIISDSRDTMIEQLHKALEEQDVPVLEAAAPLSRQTEPYAPIQDTNFLIVDLRNKPDYQNLADLHAQYPGARIVCFADEDGRTERTAMTFGGGDAFFIAELGAKHIVEAGVELAKKDLPDKKYRKIIGMNFTAGNVHVNTAAQLYIKLPPGFSSLNEALQNLNTMSIDRNTGALTAAECVVLEDLKRHRDRDPLHHVSMGELKNSVYEVKPKRNGSGQIIRSLQSKFKPHGYFSNETPPLEEQAIWSTGKDTVVLAPSYEDIYDLSLSGDEPP